MTEATTCTVRSAVTGECGKPAVFTFTGINGEQFGECADHHRPQDFARIAVEGKSLGDRVEIYRHGKVYLGTVVEIGPRGAVYADVVYGNGAHRRVRVVNGKA
jgi:hypothetical protein